MIISTENETHLIFTQIFQFIWFLGNKVLKRRFFMNWLAVFTCKLNTHLQQRNMPFLSKCFPGGCRKRAAEVASVLTSTPYKNQLMQKIATKSATKVRTKAAGKNYSFLWKSQRKGPWSAIHLWRPRRGEGSGLSGRVWTVGGSQLMRKSTHTIKISPVTPSGLLLVQRSWRFLAEFHLWTE